MTIHAVVDLETLSLADDAVILSVGVCAFDPYKSPQTFTQLLGNSRLFQLDIRPQLVMGRAVCPDTQRWWAQQSEAARDAAFHGTLLLPYLREQLQEMEDNISRWWSRGYMDMVWLKSLGWEPHFRRVRDTRTALDDYQERIEFPEGFIHHRADHDAAHEAYCLQVLHTTTRWGEG